MEVNTPFAKNCQINGWWLRISLNDNELQAVEKQHREHTKQIMKECLSDAGELGQKNKKAVMIATALFDKRAHKIYTYISNALDEKVRKSRESPCKPPRQKHRKGDSSQSHPFFRCRVCAYQSKIGTSFVKDDEGLSYCQDCIKYDNRPEDFKQVGL